MVNYKYILAAGAAVLLPASVAADVCGELPTCESLGFTYTADDCGTLKKLKCPFGDAYFCSGKNCKSVSVGGNEICTEYCADDRNVCVAKRPKTCSELLSANNCTRKNDGTVLSGTISKDICVFGTVTAGPSLNFTQVTVWDAGLRFPACESEMTGRAKLDLSSASITNRATFYTDLDLDNITYDPSGSSSSWYADFYGNTNITVDWQSSTTSTENTLSLYFSGYTNGATTNKVIVNCNATSTDQWSPSLCNVRISSAYANVTYCGMLSGTYNGKVNFTCIPGNEGSCTENGSYCSAAGRPGLDDIL